MSDTFRIQIIYSGVEHTITIQSNQCSFDDLLNKIKKTIHTVKPIKLMTVNTQESYQILSKSNYNSIIKEEFENNLLMLFANEEEEEEKDTFDQVNNNEDNEDSDSNSNDDGEFKDDSFSKEIEDEKKGNRKYNININPNPNSNANQGMSNNDNEGFNLLNQKEDANLKKEMTGNHITNKIQNIPIAKSILVDNSNRNDDDDKNVLFKFSDKPKIVLDQLNINEEKQGLGLNKDLSQPIKPQLNENQIKLSQDKENNMFNNNIENTNINSKSNMFNNSIDIKPIAKNDKQPIIHSSPKLVVFSKETCSICKGVLQYTKYICCICDNNFILCQECENNHPHPSFKYKAHFLSTFQDLFNFIDTRHEIKTPLAISGLFKKEFEVEIQLKEGEITMRPNQTFNIPITILNKTNADIKIEEITLLIRNQGKLKITYNEESLLFQRNSTEVIVLKCQSEYEIETSVVHLELYSNILKLKDIPGKNAILRIEVNEDFEEEKLNAIFKNNDRLKMLSKKNKEMINYVIEQKISKKSPEDIAQLLMRNNWILEKAMDQLS